MRARRVEDPLDADLELVRGGDGGLVHLQLTAFFTSCADLGLVGLVSFVSAKATGHMEPVVEVRACR